MENQRLARVARVNGDILSIFMITKNIGWSKIKKLSISRILYLSSVLYSFVNMDKRNPFKEDYNFIIDLHGPYTESIEYSLVFLKSNQFIVEDKLNGTYELGSRVLPTLKIDENFIDKKEWLKVIINIISVYDEDKIYEFIFRDPEYQDKILTRDPQGINIDKNNETTKVLNAFRKVFEENIEDLDKVKVDPQRYLELYFEYVFGMILKGVDE